jgi:hypothetical protein
MPSGVQYQNTEPNANMKGKPTWQAFFEARDSLNARNLASETPEHQQKHLQWERNPLTVSAKVYEWNPSIEDTTVLVHEPIMKNSRFEVLSMYAPEQKRYDLWRNEWDCCYEFQPNATLDDDMEDVVGYSGSGCDEIDPHNHNLSPPLVSSPFGPLTSVERMMDAPPEAPAPLPSAGDILAGDETSFELADIYKHETIEILAQHYGFVPPLPLPLTLSDALPKKDRERLMHTLGVTIVDKGFFSLAIARIVFDFIQKLVEGGRPEVEMWDLEDRNRVSLVSALRIKLLHCVNPNLFYLTLACVRPSGGS